MNSRLVVFSRMLSSLYTHRCASVVSNFQKLTSIMLSILFIAPLVSCALSTKVESDFGTKTDNSDSSINTIHNPQYKIAVVVDSKDDKFAKCVERGLRSRLRKSIVISEDKFRDEIYPHTQLRERPSSAVQVHDLLSNPIIHFKLLDIDLDFIVYVGGSTHWKGGDGYLAPPALPLPFILGYTQKERKTNIRTTILDIKRSRLLGKSVVRTKGIIAIPIVGLWVPIPLGLSTESSACRKTAQHIANNLVRKSLYGQSTEEESAEATNLNISPSTRAAIDRAAAADDWGAAFDTSSFKIDDLRRSARKGVADSQYKLGQIYYNGIRAEQDYREAYNWFLKAAEQGHVEAQYSLGMMYLEGKGIHDQREAAIWLKKAVEQGHAEAQKSLELIVGEEKYIGQDKTEEFERYLKEAEQGQIVAQYEVARRYYRGEGVAVDYEEAFKWFKKAAERENAESAFMISEMYFGGVVSPKDEREAARWCLKAANLGHGKAACAMGRRYSDIIGPQSYWGSKIEEYKWLWVCSQSDDIVESERTLASSKLNRLSSQFSVGTLEYANIVAKEWRPHSSLVVSDNKQESSISCTEIAGNYEGNATDNCGGRIITSNMAVDVNSDCTFVANSNSGITTNGSLTAQNGNNYEGKVTNNSGCGSFEMNCSYNTPNFKCNYIYTNGARGTITATRQ